MNPINHRREDWIKSKAMELGFSQCGISSAEYLEEEAPKLERWLKANMHGEMAYMTNYFDKRLDPRLLVPEARSVISLLFNYFPEKDLCEEKSDQHPKISKYAYGEDYHRVVKDKLYLLLENIQLHIGAVNGRVFVDSAPVMDKVWAKKSGLGWMGKHTNIITKSQGSFFFIAEIICDLELVPDGPVRDHCGTCTACIDACPTEAIVAPYQVDGSKCISYLTIELRKEIPAGFHHQMDNWVFGCDVCQDVCPWNRFSKPHNEVRFSPRETLLSATHDEWQEMTADLFSQLAKHSPLERAGLEGMKRNVKAARGSLF